MWLSGERANRIPVLWKRPARERTSQTRRCRAGGHQECSIFSALRAIALFSGRWGFSEHISNESTTVTAQQNENANKINNMHLFSYLVLALFPYWWQIRKHAKAL